MPSFKDDWHELLRGWLRRRRRREPTAPKVDCPHPERLAGLVLGELEAKVRDELMDHVVICGRCARLVKNLLMFDEHARRELGFTPLDPDESEPCVEPAHRATLPGPPTLFSWPAQPGAWGYRVVLFDAEHQPIWKSPEVAASFVPVPHGVRVQIQAGQPYYWVILSAVQGEQRSSSLHQFVVSP